jgi:hypothetical protein
MLNSQMLTGQRNNTFSGAVIALATSEEPFHGSCTPPDPNVSVQKKLHSPAASQSDSSLIGPTISPVIFIVPIAEPSNHGRLPCLAHLLQYRKTRCLEFRDCDFLHNYLFSFRDAYSHYRIFEL